MPLLFAHDKNRFSHDVAQLLLCKENFKSAACQRSVFAMLSCKYMYYDVTKRVIKVMPAQKKPVFPANIIDNIFWWCCLLKSLSQENLSTVFATRVDSKWPAQLQRLARVLKFCI